MKRIRPTKRKVIVKHEDTSDKHILSDGTELFIDNLFRHNELVNQDATVYSFSPDIDDLKEDDKVYCHHFLCDKNQWIKHEDGVYVYLIDDHIFCKIVDDEIIMRKDFVLIEPAAEPEENFITKSGIYLKPEAEELDGYGYVKALNKEAEELGLKIGDYVLYERGGMYRITIEGKEYYKMRNKHLLAIHGNN